MQWRLVDSTTLDGKWGRRDYVNRTATPRGTHEQWVYGAGNYLSRAEN
jgi:hypothetical protein